MKPKTQLERELNFNFSQIEKLCNQCDSYGQTRNRFHAWGYNDEGSKEVWSIRYQNSDISTLTLSVNYLGNEFKIRAIDPNVSGMKEFNELESNHVKIYLNGIEKGLLDQRENIEGLNLIYDILEQHNLFNGIFKTKNYQKPEINEKVEKYKKLTRELGNELNNMGISTTFENDTTEDLIAEELFIEKVLTPNPSKDDKKFIKDLYKEGILPRDVKTISEALNILK